jgi:hypothetical protein
VDEVKKIMSLANNNKGFEKRVIMFFLAFILIFSFSSPVLRVFAQESSNIEVQVEGYDGQSTLTASLIDSNSNYLDNVTTNSAVFSFNNYTIGSMNTILLNYKGIDYTKTIVSNETSSKVVINVYEPTSVDDDIIIDFHHVAISRGDNYVNITEVLQFSNIGNTVYNGTDLKIVMPEDYKNFDSGHSCCVSKTDFGFFFGIPEPLMPNTTQTIDLRYRVEPGEGEYFLEKRNYYYTGVVIITVSSDDLEIVDFSDNLVNEGEIDINNQLYNAFSTTGVFSEQGFAVTVSGYKSGGLNLIWIGTGALIVVIVGAVVIGFRGTRVKPEKLQAEEEALSSVLSELEKDYAEGKVTEVEYLKLKLKYTDQLEKIKNSLRGIPVKSEKLETEEEKPAVLSEQEKLRAEEEALSSVLSELEKDYAEGKIKEVEYLKLKLKYTEQLEKVKDSIQENSGVKDKD